MQLTDVRIVDGCMTVRFEDDHAGSVETTRLLPSTVVGADWGAMTWDQYEITVPVHGGEEVVPWSTVRLFTDPAYAAFVDEARRQHNRRMGRRIRTLRRSRKLSGKELAARAGISPERLLEIETTDDDVSLVTLGALLTAMGYDWQDLQRRRRRPLEETNGTHAAGAASARSR